MFHLVSLSLQISLADLPGPCLACVWVLLVLLLVLGGFVVGFFLTGKFDLNHMLIPVVDRPCLALVRQCRKKKEKNSPLFHGCLLLLVVLAGLLLHVSTTAMFRKSRYLSASMSC